MSEEGVKLGKATAKRVFEATRYVEGIRRNDPPDLPTGVNFGGATMLQVTTVCNPMSGGTPGANGRGRIQKLVGGSYSDFSTTAYPILNDTSWTIGVGAYVLCSPGPGGMFHVVSVDKCSNLS